MGGACSMNGAKLNVYRILVGKAEGKKQLGRPRHRWMDIIVTCCVEGRIEILIAMQRI
jgi:hypothetical protein